MAAPLLFWLVLSTNTGLRLLDTSTKMIYGHDVTAEAMSLDGRLALWQSSLTMLQANPLLGYGFDGAREALLNVASWSGSSHNGFLELGLAGGVASLCIFLIGLTTVIRTCWKEAPGLRLRTMPVLFYMTSIALAGITFNFPSYFGFLILVFLFYRSSVPLEVVLPTRWTLTPVVRNLEDRPFQA